MKYTSFINKLPLILIIPIFFFSCMGTSENTPVGTSGYTKVFSKGPVSMEMRVDKTEINTADKLTVVLEAKAGEGWKPSFPELPGTLDKFTLLTVTDSDPRQEEDGSTVIRRTFSLKPFLPGNYNIPALSMDYTKAENSGVLLSTPLAIKVGSLLPENTENLSLKGIKEPDTFNYRKLILYTAVIVFTLGVGFIFFLIYRKRKRNRIIPGLSPFEEAFKQLSALLERNLPAQGEYKEFYFQLNQIVRMYIEKQFAIRAPEQTTEEFLQDLSVSTKIGDEFKYILRDFLVHSDLIKFARHKPGEEEIDSSVAACKNFIKTTGEMSISETEGGNL